MLLRELAAHAGGRLIGNGDTPIASITHDSRAVTPGAMFVALRGLTVDGHRFVRQAIENGAVAVGIDAAGGEVAGAAGEEAGASSVARDDAAGGKVVGAVDEAGASALARDATAVARASGVPVLVMDGARPGLARLSAALYGLPARRLKVIGVTGTDGKTSLADLLAHVLESAGHRAGLISTAECRIGRHALLDTGRFTTPEAPQVQEMLARMVEAGCEWAVIEATSHGLALHRVDACEYDIAVLTNLGTDHLDFHGSPEAYRAAKARLFEMLDGAVDKGVAKTAVLNADDPSLARFRGISSRAEELTYGFAQESDVRASDYRPDGWTACFRLRLPPRDGSAAAERELRSPKPSRFNVSNAAAAGAVGLVAGLTVDAIVRGIESWPGAPGRMERVDEGQPFLVAVDFAHAPDSLRRALELMRESVSGRVIALFGCIGEHDKARRPGMAQAAADLADFTLITDDNPYSEDRDAILDDIRAGIIAAGRQEGTDFVVIPDRRDAIPRALRMAAAGDAVLMAGKGHETDVHIGPTAYPCDDREVASRVLRELDHRR